jgi:hypothetical protein
MPNHAEMRGNNSENLLRSLIDILRNIHLKRMHRLWAQSCLSWHGEPNHIISSCSKQFAFYFLKFAHSMLCREKRLLMWAIMLFVSCNLIKSAIHNSSSSKHSQPFNKQNTKINHQAIKGRKRKRKQTLPFYVTIIHHDVPVSPL